MKSLTVITLEELPVHAFLLKSQAHGNPHQMGPYIVEVSFLLGLCDLNSSSSERESLSQYFKCGSRPCIFSTPEH
jgi:hypothetical protein